VDLLETKNAENEAKIDLQEAKNAENEANIELQESKIGLQEAKNVEQEAEIIKLKAKMDAKLEADHHSSPFHSTDNIKTASINRKESRPTMGGSSTRAVIPESCRDLASLGHSNTGLYLVKNPTTKKIEIIYCDFGIPGKSTS